MKGMRPPTGDELAAIVASFTGRHRRRNRCMVVWMYYLGWRVSEVLSLTWADVLGPGGEPQKWVSLQRRYRKGHREGVVEPVTPSMAHELCAYRDAAVRAGRPLLAADRPWPFARQHAWRIVADACWRAGICRRGIGCHGLRKKHGVDVHDDGVEQVRRGEVRADPMRMASQSLGHASIASTEHYLPFDRSAVYAARERLQTFPEPAGS